MRPDRMTTKSREAFQEALDRASRCGQPGASAGAPAGGDARAGRRRRARPCSRRPAPTVALCAPRSRARSRRFPRVTGGAEPGLSRATLEVIRKAEDEAKQLKDDFVSVEHYLLAMATHDREVQGALRAAGGVTLREAARRRSPSVRGSAAHHRPGPRGEVPGAREVHAATSPTPPARARSIRSSAATRRSGA